jgi:hypothetical protein
MQNCLVSPLTPVVAAYSCVTPCPERQHLPGFFPTSLSKEKLWGENLCGCRHYCHKELPTWFWPSVIRCGTDLLKRGFFHNCHVQLCESTKHMLRMSSSSLKSYLLDSGRLSFVAEQIYWIADFFPIATYSFVDHLSTCFDGLVVANSTVARATKFDSLEQIFFRVVLYQSPFFRVRWREEPGFAC